MKIIASKLKTKAVALITALTIMFYANWAWAKDLIKDTGAKQDVADTFGKDSTLMWIFMAAEIVVCLFGYIFGGKNPKYLISLPILLIATAALFSMIGS